MRREKKKIAENNRFFCSWFRLVPNRGNPRLQDKLGWAHAAAGNIPVQGVHRASVTISPSATHRHVVAKRPPLLLLDKWHELLRLNELGD